MNAKTLSNTVVNGNALSWLTRLGTALLFISLAACLGYLCWTAQDVLVFVQMGFLCMAVAYLKPFRNTTVPTEILLDLFSVVMSFGVFIKLYAIAVEQPTLKFLLSMHEVEQFRTWVMSWPMWVTVVVYYVVSDFVAYWSHRFFHTQQLLWHSHAFHHSAKHLSWLSGMRTSLGHVVGLYLPYSVLLLLFPMPTVGILATSMLIFNMANQQYLHSNIRLPFQRQLEWVIVTPRVHFVHHSAVRKRCDSNYAFIFTCWDRMFGTYTDPDTVDLNEPLGLNYENSNWRLLIGLPPKKMR